MQVSSREDQRSKEGRSEVAIVIEALGVLLTRDGFEIPSELVEERARNAISALQSEYVIVRIGSLGLGEALAHLDAASTILVDLERGV
ncbi:MAG TPA: hypothetical protein VFG23_05475 [Polyangia bacterium]|jgi:hypothetical protein|nr:hypothetical protein [Polyangia bacterium]